MSSEAEQSVLRRMVAPPRQSPSKQGGGAKDGHIYVQYPRVADQLLGMMVEVTSVSRQRLLQEEVVASVHKTDLIFTLAGSDAGLGLIVVDAALLAALIEVQTTGRVATRPVPERVPSRTDGVVVSDIVDHWLRESVSHEGGDAPDALFGTHRENRQLDLRAVALTLDPGQYEVLRVTLSLGDGAKMGILTYFVPVAGKDGPPGTSAVSTQEVVAPLLTDLVVDMARFSIPLSDVLGLTTGALIPIPCEHIGLATLRGIDGTDVAQMALGHVSGRWAIRKPQSTKGGSAEPGFASLSLDADLPRLDSTRSEPPLTDLPDIAAISVETEVTDLPDLVDDRGLPDLPDLPDLPKLPELPNSDPDAGFDSLP